MVYFLTVIFIALIAVQPKPAEDRVILLPDADGTVGRVVVVTPAGSQEIAQAYGAVAVSDGGQITPYQESEEAIKARYGQALGSRPLPARSYLLYFQSGSDELTSDSLATLEALRLDAAQRPALEVRVIGHTDSVGTQEANEALSLQRAQFIMQRLLALGIQPQSYETVGRGELDPLVPTADEVSEPQNRRVEVSIR